MNNEKNLEVLNDVRAKLVDSCKGYQMCAEVSEDNLLLKKSFMKRHSDRQRLVGEFHSKITHLGGELNDTGTLAGSIHRGFTKFLSVFKDDTEAAVDALDTGEEHLAEYIAERIQEGGIAPEVAVLLNKAHASAVEGDRFTDLLED